MEDDDGLNHHLFAMDAGARAGGRGQHHDRAKKTVGDAGHYFVALCKWLVT